MRTAVALNRCFSCLRSGTGRKISNKMIVIGFFLRMFPFLAPLFTQQRKRLAAKRRRLDIMHEEGQRLVQKKKQAVMLEEKGQSKNKERGVSPVPTRAHTLF